MKNPIDFFRKLEAFAKCYCIALILFFTWFIFNTVTGSYHKNSSILFNISLILSGLGFCFWVAPTIKSFWSNQTKRIIFILGHALLFSLSNVLAKNVVSAILGLPYHDFDSTVFSVIMLIYIPLAIMLTTILLLFFGAVSALGASLSNFSFQKFILFGHFLGSSAVAIALFFIGSTTTKVIDKILPTYIKTVAFICDYQFAHNYPGIKPGQRICLHANGVISIATIKSDGVQIDITSFEMLNPPKTKNNISN